MTSIIDLILLPCYLYAVCKDKYLFRRKLAAWSASRRRSLAGKIVTLISHA
jgi:hypothetical protein